MATKGSSATGEAVQQAYPPPPPWYTEFVDEASQHRPPPPLPTNTYSSFGWPRLALQNEKKGLAALPQMDSDTKLFDESGDLRVEFKRLFKELVAAMIKFIDQLSKIGHPGVDSLGSSIQTIMKLHKNLQHILTLLRYWEARDDVVRTFELQLASRKKLVDSFVFLLHPSPVEPDSQNEECAAYN